MRATVTVTVVALVIADPYREKPPLVRRTRNVRVGITKERPARNVAPVGIQLGVVQGRRPVERANNRKDPVPRDVAKKCRVFCG